MSSQNIARNRSSEQTLQSGDFLVRLRNVSLDGSRNVPAPSETLQKACRPADNSNFSRDFMNYQSKIKQELRRGISSDAGTVREDGQKDGTSSLISGKTSARVSAAFVRKGNPYVSEPPVYSASRDWETEMSQNSPISSTPSEESAGAQFAASVVSRTAAAAERERFLNSDAAQAFIPPRRAFAPVSESVSSCSVCRSAIQETGSSASVLETSSASSTSAQNLSNEEKKPSAVHFTAPNEGNPFGKLLAGKEPERRSMPSAANEGLAGWFASIRCFGILGLVSGGAVVGCAANTPAPAHEFTALGISLLIAGVAMFASVGFLQAFASRSGETGTV